MTGRFRTLLARLAFWHRRASTRRRLRDLPPHLLNDIGLDAAARDDECSKWAWQGKPWQGKTWQGKTWQGKPWQGSAWRGEEAGAKENGRCLRAPVQNATAIDGGYTLRRSRTTTSTRAIS